MRKTAVNVVRHIGQTLVDKLVGAIAGSGHILAGSGRRPRSTIGRGRKMVHHRTLF